MFILKLSMLEVFKLLYMALDIFPITQYFIASPLCDSNFN